MKAYRFKNSDYCVLIMARNVHEAVKKLRRTHAYYFSPCGWKQIAL